MPNNQLTLRLQCPCGNWLEADGTRPAVQCAQCGYGATAQHRATPSEAPERRPERLGDPNA